MTSLIFFFFLNLEGVIAFPVNDPTGYLKSPLWTAALPTLRAPVLTILLW